MSTLYGTFIQTKLFRIKTDVTKLRADILVNIPLLIGEGDDWKAANISKFKVNSVEICVKPAYNFCTQASSEMGKVSVDFPLRLAFYSGNTVGEKEPETFSEYMLDSKVELGTATTGIKAQYGGSVFKTILSQVPAGEDITTDELQQKEQTSGWVDNFTLQNARAVLQKGRVALGIKLSDLVVDKENLITGDETGNGATRRIIRAILNRREVFEGEKKVSAKKGGRTGGNPTPAEEKTYCDNVVDGKLMLDYPFYVTQVYDVTYMRTAN